jgi:hypothetical protein
MQVILELYELKNLCMEMSELGAAQYQLSQAPASDEITQREAYAIFGEARVKRWVAAGLVSGRREGRSVNSPKRYSRVELLAVKEAEKLNSIVNR